jgi:hypothetical protein
VSVSQLVDRPLCERDELPKALGRERVEHRRGIAVIAVTSEVVRAERVGGQ